MGRGRANTKAYYEVIAPGSYRKGNGKEMIDMYEIDGTEINKNIDCSYTPIDEVPFMSEYLACKVYCAPERTCA